jgi:hypothetical protein
MKVASRKLIEPWIMEFLITIGLLKEDRGESRSPTMSVSYMGWTEPLIMDK